MFSRAKLALVPAALLGAVASAYADSAAAVTAIDTAKTDALAVAAALVSMGVAVWGGLFLYRKFFK